MNKLLLVVAWLVASLGAYLLVLVPLEYLKAAFGAETKRPNLLGTLPIFCIGLGCLVIAVRHIYKKDTESAVVLSQGAGLATWAGTTGMAQSFFPAESGLSMAVTLGIPLLLGISVYHLLMRGVASRARKNANGG